MSRSIPQIVISKIPTAVELTSPALPIPCSVKNCGSVLTNTGTLYLHMLKHHNIDTREPNSKTILRFFCPEDNCKYNERVQPNAKSFSSKKYLKQHYMKVHAKKTLSCSRCDKIFSSQSFKSAHESSCGQQFICSACNWPYKSKEALMTHCRRKNHPYVRPIENAKETIAHATVSKFVEIAPKASSSTSTDKSVGSASLACKKTQSTQTLPVDSADTNFLHHWNKLAAEPPPPSKDSKLSRVKMKCVKSEQTSTSNKTFRNLDIFDTESSTLMTISSYAQTDKNLNNLNYVEDDSLSYFGSENFHTELCHIETQTEYRLFHQENINEPTNSDQLDQMLYSNMHTQTCDEILSELGLADIQTQTNWPVTDYSDLLVSTETQTIDSTFLLGNSSSTQTQTISDNFLFIKKEECEQNF